MGQKTRMIVMVATALAAAACILWMQRRYEAADAEHALEIVQDYRAHRGRTIPEALAARHPGRVPSWRGTIQSSCFQHILVEATVTDGGEATVYAFMVDLNGPAIHPGNEHGRELLATLPGSQAPPSAVVSPPEATTAAAR
jgi:hypothetical protein